jgi:hypothetical protein
MFELPSDSKMIDCDKVLIERDIDGTVYVLAWRGEQIVLTCGDISSVAALREVLALVPQNISFDVRAKQ